jgi:hypothetical protein
MTPTPKEVIADIGKQSLIKLVAEHKKKCKKQSCDIHLIPIWVWLENLGVKFTEEEKEMFV